MSKFRKEDWEVKMKRDKMKEMNERLERVKNYMDSFHVEYLLVNNNLVAHNSNGLKIYDPKDTRKISRCYNTLLLWDNYKSDRVHIVDNVMNIVR